MKKVFFLIILFTLIFSYSCIKTEKNIKISVLDEFGNRISNARVLIDNQEYFTNENGELVLKRYNDKFKIFVFKENYIPNEIDVENKDDNYVEIKLFSLNSKKDEILNKIIDKIINSKTFNVQFLGNLNGKKENFNLYCDIKNGYFKISSPLLTKDIEIKKENGKFYYNDKEIPNESIDYFPIILDLISNSIEFIKSLPQNLKNSYLSSDFNYIKYSFSIEKTNLEISGFIISTYPDYKIINEQINIIAIDEMRRINDFTLNFYNFE